MEWRANIGTNELNLVYLYYSLKIGEYESRQKLFFRRRQKVLEKAV